MIDLKPEHAAALAGMLTSQAANERMQIAALMANVERIEALAVKVADGGRELDRTDIWLLADLVSGLERLATSMPRAVPDAGRATLAALRSQLDAARAKQGH